MFLPFIFLFLLPVQLPAVEANFFYARLEKYVTGLSGPFYNSPGLIDLTPNSMNFADLQVFVSNGTNTPKTPKPQNPKTPFK